jgi:hypothetical protein
MPVLLLAACVGAGVVRHPLGSRSEADQRLPNGGLETVVDGGFAGVQGWESGYAADADTRYGGRYSARCRNVGTDEHRGLTHEVQLNQTVPTPILARCWSRAGNVSAGDNADYSLYLDLEYMDGTPLWGQIAPFASGTHDWQKRTVLVFPEKPVKTVFVHGIFRRRSGTAWFDDFGLW